MDSEMLNCDVKEVDDLLIERYCIETSPESTPTTDHRPLIHANPMLSQFSLTSLIGKLVERTLRDKMYMHLGRQVN